MTATAPHLELVEVGKSFPGVRALDGVSFTVRRGELHALCGENGAGKSTLIKILSGIHTAYEGEIRLDGKPVRFAGIRDAERAGLSVITQELALVPELSVGENMFLGRPPTKPGGRVDWPTLYAESRRLLAQLGLVLDPRTPINQLGIGQQQLVEIARALGKKAELLILDEPTAALSNDEIEVLIKLIEALKARGVTIIYISHKLGEVLHLADRITVRGYGRFIATKNAAELDEAGLVALMVGRELTEFYPREPHTPGEVVVRVRDLTLYDPNRPDRKVVSGASFDIRRGEILGFSGLMGSGRTELLLGLFGAWPGKRSGTVEIRTADGTLAPVDLKQPLDAISHGLALVSEDRKRFGLVLPASVRNNLSLGSLGSISKLGVLDRIAERLRGRSQVTSLAIKVSTMEVAVGTLSGGNQQKVVLGKCLLTNPQVLFLDEPTRGIDVGAKVEIYRVMNRLVADGLAVVMVSSELPEVLGMSDRILVVHEGKLTAELDNRAGDVTQEAVMAAATGAHRLQVA